MALSSPVSIIIPTYNDRSCVCDAVECSLAQTYESKEIIVVDDGSTDGTGDLLKNRYGNDITYIYQQNRGLAGARNTGMRHAGGKYLQFLDADDLIDPRKLSLQVKQLKDAGGNALSYCDYVRCYMDDPTTVLDRMSPVLQPESPFDDIIFKWETELSIPVHCFLFETALFREKGISFDENLPNHEDWECWMNVLSTNPAILYTDSPLACYRIRRDSMCRDLSKMRRGYLMAIDKQMARNGENLQVLRKLKLRRKQIRCHYRDVSPVVRLLERLHPTIRKFYVEHVPWRIQRLFD